MKERSLKETIYHAILEDILSLEYRPGEILNEKTLIEKYNCSKSPVREALLALCADHVLRNIPRYGYEVIRLTTEDIQEMIQ
ncbi:MAG: GntR family transcriptional regulator, partial [Firmicutes bacterium]|nr:GntR family transcriptional regulator [Bacillota bacterium]MDY5856920.1 GntR family transcriptional regulator [Anaerovoracaceae bacterium]